MTEKCWKEPLLKDLDINLSLKKLTESEIKGLTFALYLLLNILLKL